MENLQIQTRAAKPGRRVAKPFLVGVIAVLLISILPTLPAAAGTTPEGNRPRIGLVLSGGGARGAAHIGVLKVLEELRNVDVGRELPHWRLAERILTERGLPWSRLTAELERGLVPGVRLRSLQRTRGADRKVQVKIKGEARTREAEAAFVDALRQQGFFEQVLLEREAERPGGGVLFDYTLAAPDVPPPYAPLPKYGPQAEGGRP